MAATIHTLLPTLSHSELLEVITKSAELCGKFTQKKKKPTIGIIASDTKSTKKIPVSPIVSKPEPKEAPKKSFAELLGWDNSDDEEEDKK